MKTEKGYLKRMSTGSNGNLQNQQKRKLDSPNWKRSLGVSLLSLLIIVSTLLVLISSPWHKSARAINSSFGFTFTGDYSQTSATRQNLQKIQQLYNTGQISFHLGLGDFSYASTLTAAQATAWSQYAQGYLPPPFPFEIVAGRHDVSQMSTYEKDLPDHIGDVSATCSACAYGQEYYFDYPPSSATPLARFIMTSPNQTIPGYTYNYNKGGADYNWVSSVIDDAHSAGIPWVIVGMHQYCFVIGTASCKNQQFLDLLLNKHVDVILEAQKHNYQRSYQLTLNSSCSALSTTTPINQACIADSSNTLTQGKGTVIVLTGTGGASQLAINTSDPKLGYFHSYTPLSTNNSAWGISQFTISATQLTEQFVPTSGSSFSDSFTITPGGGVTPSPSATATVATTLGQDTFSRPDQTYWGTSSGGQTWAGNANAYKVFSISGNTGLVTATSNTNYYAILGPTAANATAEFSGSISSLSSGAHIGAVLRWADSQNWYQAYIDGTNLVIDKKVGGTVTKLGTTAFNAVATTSYTLLFTVSGSTLEASVWATGGSQPAQWMLTKTDSSLASGNCGLHIVVQTGVKAQFTAFQATTP
jgi:hypothetical protein